MTLKCDSCGSLVEVEMNSHTAADGSRIEWPKAEFTAGQMCFFITCPKCGQRKQCIDAAHSARS